MLESIRSWLGDHQSWVVALAILSGVTALGSIVGLPFVISGLPPDYFVELKRTPPPFGERHPALRWTLRIAKSALGFVLIAVGILLLALPGQGLLMVIAGLVLAEFPGKRRIERALARRPRIMRAMNWIRRKAKKPPFETPRGRMKDEG